MESLDTALLLNPLTAKLAVFDTLAPLAGATFHNTTSLQTAMQRNTIGVGYAGAG
jgi:hypothetical protein